MIKDMPLSEKKYLNDVILEEGDVETIFNGKMPVREKDFEDEKNFLKKLEKKGVKLTEEQKKEYLDMFEII